MIRPYETELSVVDDIIVFSFLLSMNTVVMQPNSNVLFALEIF